MTRTLVSVGNYDNKDQRDQLKMECQQNPRLKFMAKNPSWRSNANAYNQFHIFRAFERHVRML